MGSWMGSWKGPCHRPEVGQTTTTPMGARAAAAAAASALLQAVIASAYAHPATLGLGPAAARRLPGGLMLSPLRRAARPSACGRSSAAAAMVFPGGGDSGAQDGPGETAPLVGFWSLLTNKLALEDGAPPAAAGGGSAGEDNLVLRADGQVAGGPRVPGWERSGVVWASEQRAAGGSWREYTDSAGKRRLEVMLLLPPASAAERAAAAETPGGRPALFYDGIVLEMRDFNFAQGGMTEKTSVRVVGTVSTGAAGSAAADRTAVSKFSMLQLELGTRKLFQSVIPFSRPFGSPVPDADGAAEEAAKLAAEREEDHDPAGMHKQANTERQMMEGLYGGQVAREHLMRCLMRCRV